jgi:hypothetical protein
MGFIELEWSTVISEFVEWQKSIKNKHGIQVSTHTITGDLENVLSALLPLRMSDSNRYLFIPTASNWSVYLDNGYRSTDHTAIRYMARRCVCRTIWIVACPHTLKIQEDKRYGRQGALILSVYGPEKTDWRNRIRTIRLENDAGKWEFEHFGIPFSFEKIERYTAKRLEDRFTFDMMKRYLRELGLSPFEEDFYLPPSNPSATLVELTGNLPHTARDVTFEEARKLNFIDD